MTRLATQHRMLALDLGAESGRAITGVFDGERLAIEEVARFANDPVELAGTLVWDFPRLFRESLDAIRRASARGPLATLAVDTWGVDFGLLDAQDRLISMPVHYRDARTTGMVEAAQRLVPAADTYAATGTQILAVNTLYQLLAMVGARDPALEQARTLLLMPDLVLRYLTGSCVSEHTIATTTQCYDFATGDWAVDLLERLGIPVRLMPPVVSPATVLGRLLPEVSDDVGAARTFVVAPAAHDTASAVAAAPIARNSNAAWISSGTWSIVGMEVERPLLTGAAFDLNLSNEGGLGSSLLLKNVTGLWLLQECQRALRRAGMDLDHATLARLAQDAPGGTAFVDADDPSFFRPGDIPETVRAFCRTTGQPEPDDAGTIVRVLLESLALKFAWAIDLLQRATGRPVDVVHIVGGGARNHLLCQLTANATGLPVQAGPVESAAIGNLLGQALAAGEIGSPSEGRELIRRSFPRVGYEPQRDWSDYRARFAKVLGPAPGVSPESRPTLRTS